MSSVASPGLGRPGLRDLVLSAASSSWRLLVQIAALSAYSGRHRPCRDLAVPGDLQGRARRHRRTGDCL